MKNKKRWLAFALLGVMLTAFFFTRGTFNDNSENSPHPDGSSLKPLGKITSQTNDTRFRTRDLLAWNPTSLSQHMNVGDSVYAAHRSMLQLELATGEIIQIGENSRATFENINGEQMLNLAAGNFRLRLTGESKLALQKEIVVFKAQDADLQIFIGRDGKPKIYVLSGRAEFFGGDGSGHQFLDSNDSSRKVASLNGREIAFEPYPSTEPPTLIPTESLRYNWRLYDFYEYRGAELFERFSPPAVVTVRKQLSWNLRELRSSLVEWSRNSDFENAELFKSETLSLNLDKAYVGANHWRVSTDGQAWSPGQTFNVTTGFLVNGAPVWPATSREVNLSESRVIVSIPTETTVNAIGFVVQASKNQNFTPAETRTFWSTKSVLNLSFFKAGTFFYRLRAVNAEQELTEWSKVMRFNVKGRPDHSLKGSKKSLGMRQEYVPPSFDPAPAPPQYVSEDAAKFLEREPAAIENESALQIETVDVNDITNERYKSSQVALQGFLWNLQSTDQRYYQTPSPMASGIGVHGMFWNGSHGAEGSVKSGVFGINDSGRESVALKNFEARYHYRFITNFPLHLAREMQTSVFAGYEIYRNSGQHISSEYDLLKFGTALDFPWSKKWSTGGEFVYGRAADASNKMEVSGKLNYFFTSTWSFGVGYRLHMFEAGSSKASPSGILPYREGYTEGYSILNYHF